MPRFFVPPKQIQNERFVLAASEAHHARDVLRKKVGDSIELFDGKNASFVGKIDHIDEITVGGVILEAREGKAIAFHLTLAQALLKGPKWDWLLEKACEIGVSEIVPLLTERTLIQLEEADLPQKLSRWNRIVLAASKQCGRADIMKVNAPVSLNVFLQSLSTESLHLIPWEKEETVTLRDACQGSKFSSGEVMIGPEGGWSGEEIDMARKKNVRPVKLGPTLLRSETAGLVAATLTLREFGVY